MTIRGGGALVAYCGGETYTSGAQAPSEKTKSQFWRTSRSYLQLRQLLATGYNDGDEYQTIGVNHPAERQRISNEVKSVLRRLIAPNGGPFTFTGTPDRLVFIPVVISCREKLARLEIRPRSTPEL